MSSSCPTLASGIVIATALGAAVAIAEPPTEFPAGPGQKQVQAACSPCHAITVVTSARKPEAAWASTVDGMITRGARVTDDDYDIIVDYLTRNFSAP